MSRGQPTLTGPTVALRPIDAADLDGLHAAASDPLIWEQHSERNRHERAVFEKYFKGALDCGGGLVIMERNGGRIIGSSRYYDWDLDGSSVVIGYTFLERAHWGGATNREVKSLMLAHAFEHVATVWFHVSPGNLRSQRALERLGARLDRREQVPVGGVPSDRLIYRIDRPQT
ncbi:MAG: GNAT family N-acetyltransferase [Phycisphaerae bacterium]|nr:GNAT family N-acetyltransferase [Phycisphaerae bacterium]